MASAMTNAPFVESIIADLTGLVLLNGCLGFGTVTVEVEDETGSHFSGTLQFEALYNGRDWKALSLPTIAGGTAVSSATAAGVWQGNAAGVRAVRVRPSAWTSGSARVSVSLVAATPTASVTGGGGVSGAVTMVSGAAASGAFASGALSAGSVSPGALASGAGVDGWDSTQGAKGDGVASSDTGTFSLIALIKRLLTKTLPAGQAAMAASSPVTIASDQSAVPVSVGAALPAGSNLIGQILQAKGSPTITQVTVPATANGIQILAANASRKTMGFYNNSSQTVYINTSNAVTTGNGWPIPAGGSFADDNSTSAWFGIVASGTADLRALEI